MTCTVLTQVQHATQLNSVKSITPNYVIMQYYHILYSIFCFYPHTILHNIQTYFGLLTKVIGNSAIDNSVSDSVLIIVPEIIISVKFDYFNIRIWLIFLPGPEPGQYESLSLTHLLSLIYVPILNSSAISHFRQKFF